MNASNKRRIDEKKCGVYSRAAFNNFLLVPAAFIRGRRLFKGGVYSREAFIQGRHLFE